MDFALDCMLLYVGQSMSIAVEYRLNSHKHKQMYINV